MAFSQSSTEVDKLHWSRQNESKPIMFSKDDAAAFILQTSIPALTTFIFILNRDSLFLLSLAWCRLALRWNWPPLLLGWQDKCSNSDSLREYQSWLSPDSNFSIFLSSYICQTIIPWTFSQKPEKQSSNFNSFSLWKMHKIPYRNPFICRGWQNSFEDLYVRKCVIYHLCTITYFKKFLWVRPNCVVFNYNFQTFLIWYTQPNLPSTRSTR